MQWIDQLPHEKSPLETVRVFQDGSYVFTQTKGDISVNQEKAARIPSWLEVAPSLHSEAAYIEADHFFHQKILLAIRRRTIHSAPTFARTLSRRNSLHPRDSIHGTMDQMGR